MAKIEVAYSIELGENLNPFEANKYWKEGKLKNKRAFQCTEKDCMARITCKNMDALITNRKKSPHYIYSSHKNEHKADCKVYKGYIESEKVEKRRKRKNRVESTITQLTFHLVRPESHDVIIHTGEEDKNKRDLDLQNDSLKRKKGNNRHSVSNCFTLDTVVSEYIRICEVGLENTERIKLDFGGGRKREYLYSELFRNIADDTEYYVEEKTLYIYHGMAVIRKTHSDGYYISFQDKFKNSTRSVATVIQKGMIEDGKYGRTTKKRLENNLNRKVKVYVLGTKNITEDKVYINIKNIDCVTVVDR